MKQKQKILLILICLALLLCAVFLPSLFWKAHMRLLAKEVVSREYDLSRTDAVLTPQVILENLGTYEAYPGTQYQSEEEEWQEIKTVLHSFLQYADPEVERYVNGILERSYLEYFSETPIVRQGEHGAIYMIFSTASLICPDEEGLQIFLYYEKKTHMILTLEMMTRSEDATVKDGDLLETAAHAYCSQLGISEKQYQCFVNPTSFLLQMVTDNTLYGVGEKD